MTFSWKWCQENNRNIFTYRKWDNTHTPIENNSIRKSFKYLGIIINIEKKVKKYYEKLLQESEILKNKLNNTHLSPEEEWVFYRTIWVPKIRYLAGFSLFTYDQWHNINSLIVNELLPRMTINRKTPQSQVYGLKLFGGFIILPLDVIHYTEMINILIRGFRAHK